MTSHYINVHVIEGTRLKLIGIAHDRQLKSMPNGYAGIVYRETLCPVYQSADNYLFIDINNRGHDFKECTDHSEDSPRYQSSNMSLEALTGGLSQKKTEKYDTIFFNSVSTLNLGTRTENCLAREQICNIGDLVQKKEAELLRIEGFGAQCICEIQDSLSTLGLALGERLENWPPEKQTYEPIKNGIKKIIERRERRKKGKTKKTTKKSKFPDPSDLTDLESLILSITLGLGWDEHRREAVLRRLKAKCTLEEAGKEMGVTRERVRQLQAQFEKRFQRYYPWILGELNKIDISIARPVFLWELEKFSPVFKKFHLYVPTIKSFFAQILESPEAEYSIESIDGEILLFQQAKPCFEEVYQAIVVQNLEKKYQGYLRSVGRIDLDAYVERKLAEDTPQSVRGKLCIYLPEIYEEADQPLSIAQTGRILKEKYGLDARSNEIGNVREDFSPDVYQFESRAWGLESKFRKLDDEEAMLLSEYFLELLKSHGPNGASAGTLLRQFVTRDGINFPHVDYLSTKIEREKIMELNHYDINWALTKRARTDSKLKDRGRMQWVYGLDASKNRVNLVKSAIKILHENGGPMKNQDLVERVSPTKDIQLHMSRGNPDLVMLDDSYWGLRGRDVDLTEHQESLIIQEIKERFARGLSIIDSAEFSRIIKKVGVDDSVSMYVLSRLLRRYVSTAEQAGEFFQLRYGRGRKTSELLIIDVDYKGKIPDLSQMDRKSVYI